MLSNMSARSQKAHYKNSEQLTRQQPFNRSILPLSLVAVALTLSACGGSGGDTLAGLIADDFAGERGDGLEGGLNGTIVQTGPYAGLNEECVNTLIPFTPAIEFVSLTCDPRIVDVDTSLPINQNSEDDPVFPGVIVPPDELVPADEPIDIPINTPITLSGLNTAPPDVVGGSYYQDSRVTALLTGPTFGTGARLNSELVKPLAVQVESVDPGLELLEVRAVQDRYGDTNADFLGVVRNISSEFRCAITLDGIESFSATGELLEEDSLDFALLDGEAASSILSDFYLSSCLQPGSIGYFSSSREADYNEIAQVTAETLSSSTRYEQYDASVLPLSYSVTADGSVSVTIVNNHSEAIDLFSVDAIAIDDQGHGFASTIQLPLVDLMPGEEVIVEGLFRYFEGSSSTMRVMLDVEPVD